MTFDQKMALTTLVFDAMTEEVVHGMQLTLAQGDPNIRESIMGISSKAKLKLRDDIVALMGGVE